MLIYCKSVSYEKDTQKSVKHDFTSFDWVKPVFNSCCLCPHRQLSVKLRPAMTHPVIAALDHPLYAREGLELFIFLQKQVI